MTKMRTRRMRAENLNNVRIVAIQSVLKYFDIADREWSFVVHVI